MKTYFVDVHMPFGWWTVCNTPSREEAKEFEKKQRKDGHKTRLYSQYVQN